MLTPPPPLPPGELFDHGLDSWSAIFLPMSLVSAFGRGSEWGISASDGFWPCLSALGGFYVSHWEKYITGILYLPWLYDIMQLVREGGREGGGGREGEREGGREGGRRERGGREEGVKDSLPVYSGVLCWIPGHLVVWNGALSGRPSARPSLAARPHMATDTRYVT